MSKFKVDVIAFYAKVQTPDDMSDAYTVDAVADTKEAEDALRALGASPAVRRDGTAVEHQGFEGKPVFKIKRKTHTRSGEELGAPTVVDSQGNPFTGLIGNGSRVRLYGKAFNWNFKGKSGTGLGLNTVQVIDLVEFNNLDKVEGGFVANTEVPFDTDAANDDSEVF
jgi:hypothetical protein